MALPSWLRFFLDLEDMFTSLKSMELQKCMGHYLSACVLWRVRVVTSHGLNWWAGKGVGPWPTMDRLHLFLLQVFKLD